MLGMSVAWLLWGAIFGAVGLGYFMYGRKQHNPVSLWSGIALMVFPYAVSNTYLLVFIGAALTALPFIFRIR